MPRQRTEKIALVISILSLLVALSQFIRKNVAVVIFNPRYYDLARYVAMAKNARLIMATTYPFPEMDEFQLLIFLGDQRDNPLYRDLAEKGLLPKVSNTQRVVVKKLGNFVFLAGYTTPDLITAIRTYLYGRLRKRF